MYSIVSCFSVKYSLEKARTFESLALSSRAKIVSKWRACCCQVGSLVSGARGELADGGSPARNRAVSSAVAVSALLAGAVLTANMTAIAAAAIILGMIADIL